MISSYYELWLEGCLKRFQNCSLHQHYRTMAGASPGCKDYSVHVVILKYVGDRK